MPFTDIKTPIRGELNNQTEYNYISSKFNEGV